MRSKIRMEIILILCGDLWHFTPFFWLLSKGFYQLSHMKTNQSIIPAPVSKPIRTFLDWVTTFHFARFVYTQCKHHFSSYLFTLHKDNTKFLPRKSFFTKNTFDIFYPFLHNLSAQAHFRLSPFSRTSSTSFTTNPRREWKFQNIIPTFIFESLMS